MKITLVGSRYFGGAVLGALRKETGVDIARVVAPAADDRLALAAKAAGIPVHVLEDPRVVPGDAIAPGTDVIVAAHTHARVSPEALARSRHGGIGYHPSLLPRHRGIAAVEWTILEGDPIAGGSVYHLAEGWDAGAVAAQDWCFVGKGETARELWERALAPMGLALLARVVRHVRDHDEVPAFAQDERFATRAPLIKRSVTVSEAPAPPGTSLVVTVVGPDRPGIVRMISERAKRFGANWAAHLDAAKLTHAVEATKKAGVWIVPTQGLIEIFFSAATTASSSTRAYESINAVLTPAYAGEGMALIRASRAACWSTHEPCFTNSISSFTHACIFCNAAISGATV